MFSVKSCYDFFNTAPQASGPWKEVWYNGTPPRVQFFLWTLAWDRISTMDMLRRKAFFLTSVCALCYQDAESSSHLFIHCPFSWEVWCGMASDFGVPFLSPLDLSTLSAPLLSWRLQAFSALGKRIWKLVLAAVCWALWRERNNWVFRGHAEPAFQVYRHSKELILFWARRCKGYYGFSEGALIRD